MKKIFATGAFCTLFLSLLVSVHTRAKANKEITIMSFNVQNLFDAEHDKGKNDYEFLPLSNKSKARGCQQSSPRYRKSCKAKDWTNKKVKEKIDAKKAFFKEHGSIPDILVLQEIENEAITKRFAKALGYNKVVFEEGPDKRGIDVAILYKGKNLRIKATDSRTLEGKRVKNVKSRLILAAYFKVLGLRGKTLAVYANHWPSQAAPAGFRIDAANTLKGFIEDDRATYGSELLVVATGDFNTIPADEPRPFEDVLMKANWDSLIDVRDEAKAVNNPEADELGTYFYSPKMAWNHLDRIFVSESLMSGHEGIIVDANSFEIVQNSTNTSEFVYSDRHKNHKGTRVIGIPYRYNHDDSEGMSDHFPVQVTLIY